MRIDAVTAYVDTLRRMGDSWVKNPEFRRSEEFDILFHQAAVLWEDLTSEERKAVEKAITAPGMPAQMSVQDDLYPKRYL